MTGKLHVRSRRQIARGKRSRENGIYAKIATRHGFYDTLKSDSQIPVAYAAAAFLTNRMTVSAIALKGSALA
ncbi:MAG: hypothetical protein AAFX40_01650 [Cyanobacteria bacterium J06639_1]